MLKIKGILGKFVLAVSSLYLYRKFKGNYILNIKNIIKVWLGVQDDIEKAKREARAEVVKELTTEKEAEVKELHGKIEVLQSKLDAATANAELANVAARKAEDDKSAAIQKFTAETSAMAESMKKSEKEWQKDKEQYSNLLKLLDSFKEEMQQQEKSGPGRPRKNVITKAFTIDRGLNSIIGFLESIRIIKKGEMTKVIHESLWEWVAPYQKMFDEYYNQPKPESANEDILSEAAVPTNTEGSAALSK